MAFDDTRLPVDVEKGCRGGPRFKTSIIARAGGYEQRNVDWARQRCEFDVSYGIRTKDDLEDVLAFFYARQGRARGFRFKDWIDYSATGESIGTGTGALTTFQLVKAYGSGPTTFSRKITRPVSGTVKVYDNGVLKTETTHYTVNYSTGLVTFLSAPSNTNPITADFEFDVPVRFDTDFLGVSAEYEDALSIGQIPIVEVRE